MGHPTAGSYGPHALAAQIDGVVDCLERAGVTVQKMEPRTADALGRILVRRALARMAAAADDLRSLGELTPPSAPPATSRSDPAA